MKKDQILKEFWEDNGRFADFFNTVFFGGREVIRAEELESLPTELSYTWEKDGEIHAVTKHRDKAKRWRGTKLVIFGIENQLCKALHN